MWRDRGMTTISGNPGSTELPMLADFPNVIEVPVQPGMALA